MAGRQGGKLKPLKQAKKKDADLDSDDEDFKRQQMEKRKKEKELADSLKNGGKLGSGLKKSGKK
ncbi:hypothetical protein GGF46_000826 [Coemansia sp. RSA 552]|nr:hypothetical protein GGF46_000826 [Coemansia sp. RSA 552]